MSRKVYMYLIHKLIKEYGCRGGLIGSLICSHTSVMFWLREIVSLNGAIVLAERSCTLTNKALRISVLAVEH